MGSREGGFRSLSVNFNGLLPLLILRFNSSLNYLIPEASVFGSVSCWFGQLKLCLEPRWNFVDMADFMSSILDFPYYRYHLTLHIFPFYTSSYKYPNQSQLCSNLGSHSGYHAQKSPMLV